MTTILTAVVVVVVFFNPLQAASPDNQCPASTPTKKSVLYSDIGKDGAVFSSSILSTATARSELDCAQMCTSGSSCLTFTFIKGAQSENCRLHGTLLTEADNHTLTEGSTSYSNTAALTLAELCSHHAGFSMMYGRYCVKTYPTPVSFAESEQRCSLDGAHIFHTKTEEDVEFFVDIINETGLGRPWVGADDRQIEGQFFWSDGTPLITCSPLWHSDQPNQY